MSKVTKWFKYIALRIKVGLISLSKLLIGSTGENYKHKLLQYIVYFLIVLIVNILVGKNIANIKYPWYSNVSIFLLVNINIVLLLVLILIIFRNLTKILTDANSKIFGARLKFKLVAFSLTITIIPVTVVFLFANTIINNSINRWFDTQIDSALYSAKALMENYQETIKEELFNQSILIAHIIADKKLLTKDRLDSFIDGYISKNLVNGLIVFNKTGKEIIYYSSEDSGSYFNNIISRYKSSVLNGNKESGYDFVGSSQIYWVGVPIKNIVVNGKVLYGGLFSFKLTPKRVVNDLYTIQASRDVYKESKFFAIPLKKSYSMLLILMSLLVIFAGMWGSIIFARSITRPVELLSHAAVEIAKGNLDVNIDKGSSDEIGSLINTFNSMTTQLRLHTKELHSKNEMLSEMYNQISKDNMYIDAIFKNVDSALILFDDKKNILKYNKKADLLRSNYQEQFKSKVYPSLEEFIKNNENEAFYNIEAEALFGDDIKFLSMSLSKISGVDEVQILLVLTDVTEIINSQRVAVWKEVATRIAHDIKNPLTPIKLMAERVKKRSTVLKSLEVKNIIIDSMDTIVNESDILLELVEEFNMFARLPKPNKSMVELLPLVEEVLSLYIESYTNIDFELLLDNSIVLYIDRYQLKRVLQNIISNAIYATSQSGKILVKSSKKSGKVEITITDNGVGIKQEDITKIFDPYFTKRTGGTGLGLAIVKKIIEEHSGQISVESSSNGSSFIIILPEGEF